MFWTWPAPVQTMLCNAERVSNFLLQLGTSGGAVHRLQIPKRRMQANNDAPRPIHDQLEAAAARRGAGTLA
jgi:hypothetical protein